MNIYLSKGIITKLKHKHRVTPSEVEECFLNRQKGLLEDTREQHYTNPPTRWFISETDRGRLLKIIFIEHSDGTYAIKSAYEPNQTEIKIYEKFA
jgi:hypothetical protein